MQLRKLIIETSPAVVRILVVIISVIIPIVLIWIAGQPIERNPLMASTIGLGLLAGFGILLPISIAVWESKDIKNTCSTLCDLMSECDKEI